jgi:peptidoglycan/LPS O-acetylase OafA/YrhL
MPATTACWSSGERSSRRRSLDGRGERLREAASGDRGLRAIAALAVLLAHASRMSTGDGRYPSMLALLGQAGVVLFFVLSGFLVGGMWVAPADERPALRDYAVRRFARIWPAYAIAFAVTVVTVRPDDAQHLWQWPVHLGLVHSWVPGEYIAIFPVGWTLGVEAAFYLIAPLLPRTVPGVSRLWGASLACAVVAGIVLPATDDPGGWVGPARYTLPALVGLFCAGVIVALRPRWGERIVQRPVACATAVAGGLVLGSDLNLLSPIAARDLRYQVLAAAFALVLWRVVHHSSPRWLSRLAPLGTISYGLYLWHGTAVVLMVRHGIRVGPGPFAWALNSALLLAASVPLAWLSWRLVERPAIRAARRSRPARRPPASEELVAVPAMS